jgi:hypothetical protein
MAQGSITESLSRYHNMQPISQSSTTYSAPAAALPSCSLLPATAESAQMVQTQGHQDEGWYLRCIRTRTTALDVRTYAVWTNGANGCRLPHVIALCKAEHGCSLWQTPSTAENEGLFNIMQYKNVTKRQEVYNFHDTRPTACFEGVTYAACTKIYGTSYLDVRGVWHFCTGIH